MEKRISITELAKIRGITTETLRHYDRIGLLVPELKDENNGYRYYSLRQIEYFDTIIDLKNLGLPLPEIKSFMENRNLEKSLLILNNKEKELSDEINRKKQLLLRIQQKIAYIEEGYEKDFEDVDSWSLRNYGERSFVVSRNEEKNIDDFFLEFTRLRQNLIDSYNMFGTNTTGSIIVGQQKLEDGIKRFIRFPAIPSGMCEETVKYGEQFNIPGGVFLCCFGRGIFRPSHPIIKRIKKYVKENNYEICGCVYERDIIDVSLTDNEKETIFRLEIPVKKNE